MNILFKKEVRRKRRNWYYFFQVHLQYYMRERVSLKEKLYTYWYNLHRNGFATKGEVDYFMEIEEISESFYDSMRLQFDKDLIEYLNY